MNAKNNSVRGPAGAAALLCTSAWAAAASLIELSNSVGFVGFGCHQPATTDVRLI
ncbi:MAG: hypothetical protein ACJ8KA_12810 [Sulfurifustis sp.]